MQKEEFLEKYLNNNSPTGNEVAGQKLWLSYLKPYIDDYFVDNYGTVVGVVNPEAEYKVVLEAHADEISWYVSYITEEGYLHVIRNGGIDALIAPSMRADIHGDNGLVKGVFGWPAIHMRSGANRDKPSPTVDTVFVDVGCSSREEVEELGIHVGTVITYEGDFMKLNNKYYTGRALDNRMGGYMIAEAARRLHEEGFKPEFGLYIVNSVQEEVGLRGAQMIAERIKPNAALITDVCHDTTHPMMAGLKALPKEGKTKCGEGPVFTYAPAVHNTLLKMLFEVCKNKEIAYQLNTASRVTGTDTDAFAYSGSGVPSALVSLPLKYMHSTVETASIEDTENTITVMQEFVKQIKNGQDFRYFT